MFNFNDGLPAIIQPDHATIKSRDRTHQHYKTFAQLGQNFFQNGQATQFWGPGAPATELPLIFFLSWRTPCRIMMAIAIDGHRRRHGTSSCYVSSQIVSTICP